MRKAKAKIHSTKQIEDVNIIEHNSNNDVIAEYKGKKYTAIFNCFNNIYYVDDIYGEIWQD